MFISQSNTRRLWYVASTSVLCIAQLTAGIKEDAEEVIFDHFGPMVELKFEKLMLTKAQITSIEHVARQRFYTDFVYHWSVVANNHTIGYALLDNVKGKSMPITFLVLYDPEGNIQHSVVIKYREAYGGEVGRRQWLDQFSGKNASATYNEIDAISGATISVQSLTKGIQKLTLLCQVLQKESNINE